MQVELGIKFSISEQTNKMDECTYYHRRKLKQKFYDRRNINDVYIGCKNCCHTLAKSHKHT